MLLYARQRTVAVLFLRCDHAQQMKRAFVSKIRQITYELSAETNIWSATLGADFVAEESERHALLLVCRILSSRR